MRDKRPGRFGEVQGNNQVKQFGRQLHARMHHVDILKPLKDLMFGLGWSAEYI